MKFTTRAIAFALVAAFISGCSSTDEKDSSLTDGSIPEGAEVSGIDETSTSTSTTTTTGFPGVDSSTISGMEIQGIDAEGNAMGGAFDDPQHPLSKQTIYFMYDSSQVQPEYISVINAHALYLASHPSQRVILEGHADERGSREYNIALSEQRAKSVARAMEMEGVSSSQLSVVSYGEEKPAIEGFDESAWGQNRRVVLVYRPK